MNPDEERTHHSQLLTNYKKDYENISLVDLCMRAEAVPGYFSPYQGYLSGMLIENNPVILTFPYLMTKMEVNVSDIICLNISDGLFDPIYFNMVELSNAGGIQWAPQIPNLFQKSRVCSQFN